MRKFHWIVKYYIEIFPTKLSMDNEMSARNKHTRWASVDNRIEIEIKRNLKRRLRIVDRFKTEFLKTRRYV